MSGRWRDSRMIQERVIVTGDMVLETPALLGSGDAEGLVDMPLLIDPLEGRALLTGSSIAGALRNYLRRYNSGLAEIIFGSEMPGKSSIAECWPGNLWQEITNNAGEAQGCTQSLLFVDDALGDMPVVELRDGVAVNPRTGTAEDGAKYDLELLAAGSPFKISLELLVLKGMDKKMLFEGLALALQGLGKGEIALGGRKSRGFGRCKIRNWQVVRYDLTGPEGMLSWLANSQANCLYGPDVASLLGVSLLERPIPDKLTLQASFTINGSLINRSPGQFRSSPSPGRESIQAAACLPDTAHLHSRRDGDYVPVASGTSLAGVLRSRAIKIANTLGKDAYSLTNSIFGYRRKDHKDKTKPAASRLWVEETVIQNPVPLVQSRIIIDRFTGGAYPGALFDEQPVFGKEDTSLEVKLSLDNPENCEIGLLLLLLKDLWTGDLALGGESAIGRGRLSGKKAGLAYAGEQWTIVQAPDGIIQVEGDASKLEEFVRSCGEVMD